MNLSNLRTRILQRVGRAGDTTLNSDILYALETVQEEVMNTIDFPELVELNTTDILLVANQQTYNLPTDFGDMLQVWDTSSFNQELRRINPKEYKVFLGDVTGEHGTNPRYYDILDNALSGSDYVKRIKFFPYPSTILNGVIATFTDYSGTVAGTVEITDTAHGLTTGDSITISGTTNYDGVETITKIDDDNFYITATYVAEAGGATKLWTKNYYIPFAYKKSITLLASDSDENILTYTYPNLFVEGAAYYMYRDVIYRDDPAKIAFRRGEYDRQMKLVEKSVAQSDRLSMVMPKRLIGTITKQFSTQYTGYTS